MTNTLDIAPLVSVVITTYNYASYLPRAIQSVLTHGYNNLELIIIDDGGFLLGIAFSSAVLSIMLHRYTFETTAMVQTITLLIF